MAVSFEPGLHIRKQLQWTRPSRKRARTGNGRIKRTQTAAMVSQRSIGELAEGLLLAKACNVQNRSGDRQMFIAMNRFRVARGSEADFEHVWMSRDSHLDRVPGFMEFHLLKGPEAEDHTLYASHTVWKDRAVFEAWTKSEAFRAAHQSAGSNKPLYLGPPQFEGFEVVQTVGRGKAEAV
jgi:heme-degrading monooxygenase HmoA